MFEFIRTHQRLMQFLLLLFIFPSFAFFGLESYTRFRERDNAVAKVAGQSITQQEWDAAQREQLERYRQMFGPQFDPKMLDTPEAKQGVLDSLIAQRVLAHEVVRQRLSVSDQTLQQTILGLPGMTGPDGKFDGERYKSLLAMQGMTPASYEARLRHDMAMQQITNAIQATAFAPKTVANKLSDLNDQEREVQSLLFKPSDFASQVKVTDEMLKAYYDKNISQFEIPEQIKAEYIVLDNNAIASQIQVSDADVKSYYEQNAKRYTTDEERHIRHIELKVKPDAPDAEKAEIKAKAERLLAQVRKSPTEFTKLAKEYSEDKVSAEQGGDLGFVIRGGVPKEFEDVAFKLKQGEISDLTQVGSSLHIIQVTEIKPGAVQPLDAVRAAITAEIRKQLASKKYAEMAEVFTNTVYEQSDSLKPAADKLKLNIQTANNLTRSPNPAIPPAAPYNNPKFLKAIFSDDAIKNKRNTEAVEVAPSTLVAGRIVEYKPVTRRPLEEVKDAVRERVVQAEALNLARKAGEEKLAALKAGGDANGMSAAKTVSRAKTEGMSAAALKAIMKADVSKLPAYAGAELGQEGYGVYRINKVAQPAVPDAARRQSEQQQIVNALAQQEMLAYLESLKKKAKVEIVHGSVQKSDTDAADKK